MVKFNKFEKKLLAELNAFGIPEKGKRVVVGLSGGADSVSLLVSLNRISSAYPLKLYAVHLNHMLRGDEAQKDMQFAKNLCEKLSIPFCAKSADVKGYAQIKKIGIEEAARKVRYEFFNEFSEKNQIDYILTAHNMNDVAETVLFHIIRGCGISGLNGINRQRDNIIRPLLNFTRDEIEEYCNDLELGYVVDSTNSDTDYSRNYIRHIILPEMKKLNPSIVSSLSRLSSSAFSANQMLDVLEKANENTLSNDLPEELLFRRLKKEFSKISARQVSYDRLNAVKSALRGNNEVTISFPDEIECVVNNGEFLFRQKCFDSIKIREVELFFGENIISDDIVIEISNEKILSQNNDYGYIKAYAIDKDQIKGNIRVRSRQEGDSIRIGGMTRSIKKQFIEKRIPKENRDLIPIIFDDDGIVCVPEVGVADRVRSNGDNNVYIGIHSRKVFR